MSENKKNQLNYKIVMLKKLIILLFIAMPLGVFAQDKIAYINTQEIFGQMPELSDVESKFATRQEEIRKSLQDMEAEYQKKLAEFQNDTTTVTQSILEDRRRQLDQIQERYEKYAQDSQKELAEYQQQLVSPLQQKLQKAIQKVGADKGFTYIIEAGVLLYVAPGAVNVGDLVKAELGIK